MWRLFILFVVPYHRNRKMSLFRKEMSCWFLYLPFSFLAVPRHALYNSECKKVNYITPNLRFIELEVLSSCFIFGLFWGFFFRSNVECHRKTRLNGPLTNPVISSPMQGQTAHIYESPHRCFPTYPQTSAMMNSVVWYILDFYCPNYENFFLNFLNSWVFCDEI